MKIIIAIFSFFLSIFSVKAETLTIVTPAIDDAPFTNARIFANYFLKYLPEFTRVEFRHVPGAGGITAANYLYNIAPRDGRTIGISYKHIPFLGVIKESNVEYDSLKFNWLGSTQDGRKDVIIMLSHKKLEETLFVGSHPIPISNPITFVNKILDVGFKPITGYKNPNDVRISFERKEIDSFFNNLTGIKIARPQWLVDNNIKIIMQFGNGKNRHVEFPNTPTLTELASSYENIIRAFEEQYVLLRPFLAPPDIPNANRLKLAFITAARDVRFAAELKTKNIDVSPIDSTETQKLIQSMTELNQDIVNFLK